MFYRNFHRVFTGLVVLLSASLARADIATPRPHWTAVQMQSEEVNITLGMDKVKVEATFVMLNTGKDELVRMGYPLGLLETALNEFTVSADGQTISEAKDQAPKPQGFGRDLPGLGGGESKGQSEAYRFSGPYQQWKVFDVPMKAGRPTTVKLSYWVTPAALTDRARGEVLCYSYTLRTGATWKGNIEQAVLRVKLDGVKPEQIINTAPVGMVKSGDGQVLTWTLRDFKPTDDLVVVYSKTGGLVSAR